MTGQEELVSVLSAQAKGIVDNAKQLGLTWTLRPGTATLLTGSTLVVCDGDTVGIGVVSLIGNVIEGQRVMMLQVPPGGNYILGDLTVVPATSRVDSATGTAASAVEAVALTTPAMDFVPGRAYRIAWGTAQLSSVPNVVAWRVREGTSTAGTAVYLGQRSVPGGVLGVEQRFESMSYVINATSAIINTELCLTHLPSVGTTTGVGSTTQVRYLEVTEVGADTNYPNSFPLV